MFEEAFGSVSCLDLTACDLSTPEGRRIYEDLKAKNILAWPSETITATMKTNYLIDE